MTGEITELAALVAVVIAIGGGFFLVGRITERVSAAHHRINRLERYIREEFEEVRSLLKESQHCPLAEEKPKHVSPGRKS